MARFDCVDSEILLSVCKELLSEREIVPVWEVRDLYNRRCKVSIYHFPRSSLDSVMLLLGGEVVYRVPVTNPDAKYVVRRRVDRVIREKRTLFVKGTE